jgi:enamine deaminase RidA (YjgF/YER057c/UK114 family)
MRLAMLVCAGLAATPAMAAEPAFDPEARLRDLGITLPQSPTPVANYVQAVRSGDLVFLAGHGPCGTITDKQKGKVPRDRTVEEAYAAARDVGMCLIASLKKEIGDLRKVRRVVKVLGMVNATESFTDHPKVVNGCSDLLVAVFGERGKHARAAVGMVSLPVNLTVEIEMVVEVEP